MANLSEDYHSTICFFYFLHVCITSLVVGCFRRFDYYFIPMWFVTRPGKMLEISSIDS